jgi:hypothetical protein
MSFPSEIRDRLISQGIAAAKIGISSSFVVPATGEYLVLTETGGTGPYHTHNSGAVPSLVRPSMQLLARAATYVAAMTLARAAYTALLLRDTTLSGTRYLLIEPLQEPFDLGLDANGRAQVAFNIRAEKSPS